jgi:hypothetical protein
MILNIFIFQQISIGISLKIKFDIYTLTKYNIWLFKLPFDQPKCFFTNVHKQKIITIEYMSLLFFSCVDTSPCSKNEFECGNRMCVSDKAKCNGIYDCFDQSDEKDCGKNCPMNIIASYTIIITRVFKKKNDTFRRLLF